MEVINKLVLSQLLTIGLVIAILVYILSSAINKHRHLGEHFGTKESFTVNNFTSAIVNMIYPVGSIYTSLTNDKPEILFPGTSWILLEDGYYLKNSTESVNQKGGAATHSHVTGDHTLTVDELPKHSHAFTGKEIKGTVSDILRYDSDATDKDEAPTGCFTWEEYGSRTWEGADGKKAGLKITFKATPSGDISQTGNNKSHSHGNTTEVSSDPLYITCHMWKRTG